MAKVRVKLTSPDAPLQLIDGAKLTGTGTHLVEETEQVKRAITGNILQRVTEPEPVVKKAGKSK